LDNLDIELPRVSKQINFIIEFIGRHNFIVCLIFLCLDPKKFINNLRKYTKIGLNIQENYCSYFILKSESISEDNFYHSLP